MAAVWISKREAIALVIAAERPDAVGSRASARSLLNQWVHGEVVRTKDGERPAWAKRPRQLYRRTDVERRIRERSISTWTPAADALLGTDTDEAIGRKLRRPGYVVAWRRKKLKIPAHGAGGGRRNPSSWRLPHGDPRLAPPTTPHG